MKNSDVVYSTFSSLPNWSKPALIDRARAAGKHFLITLFIGILITIPLIFWLYPFPFFEAAGGMHLLGIVLIVDVVLGPTLTFLVFDRKKKTLKNDILVIATMQLVALIYGLLVTGFSRPVFMTYVVDRFEIVSAAEFDEQEFARAPKYLFRPKWGAPQQAFAEQPIDPKERESILFSSTQGLDLKHMFRYYKPLENGKAEIIRRAKPVSELKQYNSAKAVEEALPPPQGQPLSFVPLQGKKKDLVALVNSKTGDLVKVVDLRPWLDSR